MRVRFPSGIHNRNKGFPPLVYGALGFLAAFFLIASLLTSGWIVLFGINTDGKIVALTPGRRVTVVTIEYVVDGKAVRSSRGVFNGDELAHLARRVGRLDPPDTFIPRDMIGAEVRVRYARGRPELAHIRSFVPMYREFIASQVAWIACAVLAWFTWKRRRLATP